MENNEFEKVCIKNHYYYKNFLKKLSDQLV